jgi:parvulin-like peptidyl-prolyl isomerase
MIRQATLCLAVAAVAWTAEVNAQDEVDATDIPLTEEAAPTPAPLEARLGDRIMAVVGDDLLLESEWVEQTLILAEQLGVDRGTPQFDAIATGAFDQIVRNLVIVSVARRDTTIVIDEELVLEQVDREIEQISQRFPSEADFRRELESSQWGSLAAYRADIQDRKRREMLGEALLEVRRDEIKAPTISDAEVRAYWDENRAGFGRQAVTLRFEEITVTLKPAESARDAARSAAEGVLEELNGGLDFASAARQYSGDTSTREDGGDLGWFGRGRMVASFEEAAFDAVGGELIGPIESPFGFHIIQVLDQRPEERRARHILLSFERTAEDRARAQLEAEAMRDLVRAGADIDSLQAIHMPGDSIAGTIIDLPASQLPAIYQRALQDLEDGDATVIETASGFSVLVGHGQAGGEEITFEEIAPRIRQQLEQEQAEEAFVQRLREQVFVDIRVRPERALSDL